MFRKLCLAALLAAILALIPALPFRVLVNAARRPLQGRDVITQQIDESKRVVLRGNTRPEANRGNDRGYVGDDFPLEHMFLQLKRSAEQEQALDKYIDELSDRNSANSHQWLTATELGQTYGVSDADIEKITKWLGSYGIRVNVVYPNHLLMDISGTAAQLGRAFHVEIHYVEANRERHFANLNDPQIPEAFAQSSSGGSASLVILKWKKSTTQSAISSGTPTAATPSTYRNCTVPCSLTLTFSGGANDIASSVFCDYGSDTIYVGDDSGRLHKFIGVFSGTPAEASGAWPVSVSLSAPGAPVYDSSSGNVLVGDYLLNLASTCGPSGEPCGFFYSVKASTGSIVGTSNLLDYVFGIVDAPLVDSSAGEAYVFAGADSSFSSASACGTDVPCSGVFQFPADFTSGSGAEVTVGPGYEFLLPGTFDNEYFSSSIATAPTGHLYVVGGTGQGNNTLYQISINSNVMSATVATGPAVSTNYTDGYYSAGLQITEVYTGSKDYIFVSVLSFGAPAGCSSSLSNGCVMGFDVTSASIGPATTPTGATAEAGGTSAIIVDNTSTFGGASNIYYTPLANQACPSSGGTGGCAIQISQAAP